MTAYDPDLYKKWYRTKTQQGFLTLRPWLEAGKLSVDIGEVGDTVRNTVVFTDLVKIHTFLMAVRDGRAEAIYGTENFVQHGGGFIDNRPVARVLNIEPQTQTPATRYLWQATHLPGKQVGAGAFVPEKGAQPLSRHAITVTRPEMAEIATLTDLCLHAFVNSHPQWPACLAGNYRKDKEDTSER